MKRILMATSALTFAAGAASAAGIDRPFPGISTLFEDGNYVQFSFTTQNPSVSGKHSAASVATTGASRDTENMAKQENQLGFALKMDLTEQLSFGFFAGNPYGAKAEYTQGNFSKLAAAGATACPAALGGGVCVVGGSTNLVADWRSTGYEALLKYKINERASVYGGLRAVTSQADIGLPIQLVNVASNGAVSADYTAESSQETDLGYTIGAAYEIPDIAARIAVTYRSEIQQEFSVNESFDLTLTPTAGPAAGLVVPVNSSSDKSKTKITLPQSLTIDFQTGIAQNTLLFGSAKWTEWSKWEVRTDGYENATGGAITGFENDTWTYNLGVGHRLNDNLSVFASVGYEEKKGGDLNRLAPTDGFTSLALGGSYKFDDGMTIRAGITQARLGGGETSDGTVFEDNEVTGFGMSLGFTF